MHPTSEDRFKEIAIPHFANGMRVLEIGPDNVPSTYYKHLVAAGIKVDWSYASLETNQNVPGDDPRRIPMRDEYRIGCPDEDFDIVFHGQVFEHSRKIWRFVVECARVLKTGGKMIAINPADWRHHEPAPDCWRIYPEGIRALFEEAGINCEYSEFFAYADVTADTVSVGVKVSQPLIQVL